MTPLASVRASAPVASSLAAPGDGAPAPGFAALLEAAREPAPAVEPDAPAQGDAPEAPATDMPEARAAAKPARKPPALSLKVQRDAARGEAPAAVDGSASLSAKATPVASADAAPAVDTAPPLPAADAPAPPLPNPPPAAPAAVASAAAPAPAGSATAAPPRAALDAPGADPLPQAAPDASTFAPTGRALDRGAAPKADALPTAPAKTDAAPRTPAAGPLETTPLAAAFAAPQAPLAAMPPGPSAATPFAAHLAAALESPAFAPALATQVRWLVEGGVQHAQLTLNPAEMGPVAVRIAVEGTQARIDFMADLAPTRAALEASLPTLAAALADGGLTLAGGGVFDGSSARQSQPDAQGAPRQRHAAATAGPAEGAPRAPNLPARARGLVDLVA